ALVPGLQEITAGIAAVSIAQKGLELLTDAIQGRWGDAAHSAENLAADAAAPATPSAPNQAALALQEMDDVYAQIAAMWNL
ncbi:MAG: hypothetical protein KGR26_14125, partial [Cyanobacteria bacterium REEB65]|nr:hypothetical protein [Cyanobacteria bacterium REEB65]